MEYMKEISNFEELRKLRLADEGYFLITDSADHATVHKVDAKCIDVDNFITKVTIDGRWQGEPFLGRQPRTSRP